MADTLLPTPPPKKKEKVLILYLPPDFYGDEKIKGGISLVGRILFGGEFKKKYSNFFTRSTGAVPFV